MVVVNPGPGHIESTGINFMVYAKQYRRAARAVEVAPPVGGFDPVVYHLYCASLELHLKSFIWLTDRISTGKIKKKYGHDIVKLWRHAKQRRIDRYLTVTDLRDEVISLVGPYYKNRKFSYLDLTTAFRGYKRLKSEPRIVPTLRRLTTRLEKTLRTPILSGS